MKLAELQPRQGKVDIEGKIIDKAEPRTFQKFGEAGRVCNAKIQDESGTMKLTLWNEQVDQVNVGDTVKVTNGYVSEWQGEPQLSTGKFGQLEVVRGEETAKSDEPKPEAFEAKEGDAVIDDSISEEETI